MPGLLLHKVSLNGFRSVRAGAMVDMPKRLPAVNKRFNRAPRTGRMATVVWSDVPRG